ncbi:hypothetical protein CDD82_4550 [Ophiocordyceps australis]|uniref:DUF159 domain protein n=1 Tax=Ophiocordyceps australis TaxID=1399860 RepID=A0A2C5Z598_9HYPO|nr:hypothetical protein CDD82_4550 [Ophiocordyceps australis]
MKWGLLPSRDSAPRINCRDDSLCQKGGVWESFKARKRCVVVAQGFYEWLRVAPREKVPHYVKRRDGRLLCLAGLWDCVEDKDSSRKIYSYTIITTSSNSQLSFLHDRMPVILDASAIHTWLDPALHTWSSQLESLLRPYPDPNALDIYPVSKDVGKVGNESPTFIIPVNSRENKANIANFFDNARRDTKVDEKSTKHLESNPRLFEDPPKPNSIDVATREENDSKSLKQASQSSQATLQSKNIPSFKRKTPPTTQTSPPKKIKPPPSPAKTKAKGSQKITSFFSPKS